MAKRRNGNLVDDVRIKFVKTQMEESNRSLFPVETRSKTAEKVVWEILKEKPIP